MKIELGQVVRTPSDFANFTRCRHRATLDLRGARGELEVELISSAMGDLLGEAGIDHEGEWLATFNDEKDVVVEIPWDANSASATLEAMGTGADVIYQAAFDRDGWRGNVDFLLKVDAPSALGDWSYEPADAKMARSATGKGKQKYWAQVWVYARALGQLQGRMPDAGHVLLVDSQREVKTFDEMDELFADSLDDMDVQIAGEGAQTSPWHCGMCSMCTWSALCADQLYEEDSLDLIPGLRIGQAEKLGELGINTVRGLSTLNGPVKGIKTETLTKHVRHARLQTLARDTGEPQFERLPDADAALALLPPDSPGDLFFDLEWRLAILGDLFYLFGTVSLDARGEPTYEARWSHDEQTEGQTLDAFIAELLARRERFPDFHVWHFSHPEKTSLEKLAQTHGRGGDAVAELIESGVFVDLRKTVEGAVATSLAGYGLKKLETFYGDEREDDITDAMASMAEYEDWRDRGMPSDGTLERLADYNRADCQSLLDLRRWLRSL